MGVPPFPRCVIILFQPEYGKGRVQYEGQCRDIPAMGASVIGTTTHDLYIIAALTKDIRLGRVKGSYLLRAFEDFDRSTTPRYESVETIDCDHASEFLLTTPLPSHYCVRVKASIEQGINYAQLVEEEMILSLNMAFSDYGLWDVVSLAALNFNKSSDELVCEFGHLEKLTNVTAYSLSKMNSVHLFAEGLALLWSEELQQTVALESSAVVLQWEAHYGSEVPMDPNQAKYFTRNLYVHTCLTELMLCDKVVMEDATVEEDPQGDTVKITFQLYGREQVVFADKALVRQLSSGQIVTCASVLEHLADPLAGAADLSDFDALQTYISPVLMVLSMLALVLTLVVFSMFPSLRTVPGVLAMQLCVSMFGAQLLLLVGHLARRVAPLCTTLAALQHYMWMASFCLMNAYAMDVTMAFRVLAQTPNRSNRRLLVFTLYAWTVPALVVAAFVLLDELTEVDMAYGGPLCWIVPTYALLYWFAVPLAVLIAVNIGCFILTLIFYLQTRKVTAKVREDDGGAEGVKIAAKLSSVMGLTWVVGFLANIPTLWPLWYVFIVLNSLQGVTIALTFVLNRRVLGMINKWRSGGEGSSGHMLGTSSRPTRRTSASASDSQQTSKAITASEATPEKKEGEGEDIATKSEESMSVGMGQRDRTDSVSSRMGAIGTAFLWMPRRKKSLASVSSDFSVTEGAKRDSTSSGAGMESDKPKDPESNIPQDDEVFNDESQPAP